MRSVLGKRKASSLVDRPEFSQEEAAAIFRQHFEAQFKPLEVSKLVPQTTNLEEDDDDDDSQGDGSESEWGGVSAEGDEDDGVEVIDHSVSKLPSESTMTKRELKSFMSSRPPNSLNDQPSSSATKSKRAPASTLPEDSAALLANDLALQRLLSESHLLSATTAFSPSPSSLSTTDPNATHTPFTDGRTRRKALDLRVQSLLTTSSSMSYTSRTSRAGSFRKSLSAVSSSSNLSATAGDNTNSIFAQKNIPMALRKAQTANKASREAKRRKEARENGLVLERDGGGKQKRERGRREAEVGLPSVGKMRGAELRLSQRDVRELEGGSTGGRDRGRGRSRSRGRR